LGQRGRRKSFHCKGHDPAIGSTSATIANSGPVSNTVTHAGADTVTLNPLDIGLNATDSANATISVDGTGSETRTVTLSDVTGDGMPGISISAIGTGADATGNETATEGPSETLVADNTEPTVSNVTGSTTEALRGDKVTIPFDLGEPRLSVPMVTVHDAAATRQGGKGVDCAYGWTAREASVGAHHRAP